ncbi:MAG: L,D-transpeptidase family protein [Sulfurimonas sp.]
MRNKFYALFLLLLIHTSIFAADLLTDYRLHGINNIEKQMDSELAKQKYWNNYLKNISTTFGYIESYSNILTCNKDNSTLCVYVKDNNNSYKLKKEYSAYTGKNRGNKRKEGDLKTPIGIYNITKKISKVDPFYGPLAFVTSYPNGYDKYLGKGGHGIWIHGLPINQERDTFTKGCIAIQNDSIECLNKNLDITKTLLLINQDKVKKDISKKKLSILLSQLYKWRYTWLYNDIKGYLDFYAENFVRSDGMEYQLFVSYKKRIFQKQEKKKIIFTNINVIPYPGTQNLYKISFKEFYKSKSFEFSGDKVLMAKLIDNKIKILTEK